MADYSPIDFGAAFANAGRNLPDYAAEAYNESMARTQAGTLALNRAKQQREVDEEESAQADYAELEKNPTTAGWVGFIMRHPKFAEEAKAAKGYQDKDTEKRERTLKGQIFSAAGNGEFGMAADLAQQRYDADEAAGNADPHDKLIIQALRSDDPAQRNKAITMIGFDLALDDPEHFASTMGALFPDKKKLEYHENAYWDPETGEPVVQSFYGQNITTPVGTKQLGRMPGVNIAGLGVTPEGLPATPGPGVGSAPGGFAGGRGLAQGFNPNAPSLYAPGGPGALIQQPGQMPAIAGPMAAGVPGGWLPGPAMGGPPGPAPMEPYYPETPGLGPADVLGAGPGAAVADPLAPLPIEPGSALAAAVPARATPASAAEAPPHLRDLAQATDVRNFLVNNAKAAVKSIFPGARVTEWKRNPKSKLGKANPQSWHNLSKAAVDIAPIPGLSFGAFIDRIKGDGYKIVESRDEVKNPSKHATGPHWHTVLQLWPARSKQEFDKIPNNGRFIAPDGTERRKVI